MSESHRRLARVAWCLTLLAVIVGELLPGGSLPMRVLAALHLSDKLEHFTSYAILAFLPALYERTATLILIAIAVVGLGVLLEFAQKLTQTRTFDTADMAANTAGVFAGIAIGLLLRSRAK